VTQLDFSAPPPDDIAFRDVRKDEIEQLEAADKRIATLQAAITMADGVLQMASGAGFQLFVQALRDMRQSRMKELFGAKNDREANILTGRCLELEAVINVVDRTKSTRQTLAEALAGAQDARKQLERRIPPPPIPREPRNPA
jgi:soluble lytic murein transglycosylase-like protein